MAGWSGVNVATITEEDVIGEEIGEDGMVEMIATVLDTVKTEDNGDMSPVGSDTPGEDEGRMERQASLERPSSLVEKEDVDTSDNSSILKSITFESESNTFPKIGKPRTSSTSSRRSLSPSPPSPVKKPVPRRGSRSIGLTLNLSDKFVTELTLHDPCVGAVKGTAISLGVFLATDQVMGDHFIYKVSPVSPLAVLKFKPQDRLLKINDISLAGWSHNCLLDYVRNLPFTCVPAHLTSDAVIDIQIVMEVRRSVKNVRSGDEAPVSKRLDFNLRLKRKRATVTWVQERETKVQYRETQARKLKLKGDTPLYLTTSFHPDTTITKLSVGVQEENSESAVSFHMHSFDMVPSLGEGVEVVVLEAAASEVYLHAVSNTQLALMQGVTSDVKRLTQADVRFFFLESVAGSSLFTLKSFHTGGFVSATPDGVSLVEKRDGINLPENTLFEVLPV
ncbi:hypothetical protein OTU49_006335 [Cherax quadricarinatus]|uniref:PDZ domain-containing protein n=1 Tax=Cherax quadricarinatus TaxID=27406 RepID=A0AAW0WZQ4_CHEQU